MSSRKLAIEYLPVASLRPDPKNARLHSDKQVQQIARSIEAFGFNVPVLVDANSQVMAGHGRLLACKLLDIAQVPVIRLEHLSQPQMRAFMIADNRLTENSEWDNRLLGEQLEDPLRGGIGLQSGSHRIRDGGNRPSDREFQPSQRGRR